jgi:predicted nuclease of restriction endonuclease-like (RecB) superfamily
MNFRDAVSEIENKKAMAKITSIQLFKNIKTLVVQSQQAVYSFANTTIAETNFHVGRMIVEHEQQGSARADYAKNILITLSEKLNKEFGKGYSVDTLENMRKFYLIYKDEYFLFIEKNSISETASRKLNTTKNAKSEAVLRKSAIISKSETASRKSPFLLSWSHYNILTRIENSNERKFYEIECYNEKWIVKELKRNYESALYERLVMSRNKQKVKELSKKGQVISTPQDLIRDPYVMEFLQLQLLETYSEKNLEDALISQLQNFLKELGKGFLFVERQKRIRLDGDDFAIDLVFYNRILKCFVLIDLKIGSLQHKDIGQMQMYVNYFDEHEKDESENKTIGIILCKNKKESVIKYTLGKENKQIFASKYKLIFPEKQILKLLNATNKV